MITCWRSCASPPPGWCRTTTFHVKNVAARRFRRLSGGGCPSSEWRPNRQGQEETIRARYVVGCDGARSTIRQSIGRSLVGDVANQAWGVMDVLAVTDFPDIRLKSVIHSANEGNVSLHHPPRGRLPGPLLHRARQAQSRSAPHDEGHHDRAAGRSRKPDHSSLHPGRQQTSLGGPSTRSASVSATSSTMCQRKR